jgi:hypothetical protein
MPASTVKSLRSSIVPLLGVLLLGFALGGCASPSRVPLTLDRKNQSYPTKTAIIQSQQEIGADIVQSNIAASTGGGLIPALIDLGINNSRAKKAVTATEPVRDSLIGYDAGRSLEDALSKELASRAWPSVSQIEIRPLTDRQTTEQWINGNTSSAILAVSPYYRLTSNFDGILVHATVRLQGPVAKRPKSSSSDEESTPKSPLWYLNSFAVVIPITGPYTTDMSTQDAAAIWAADNGRKAREALDTGFSEIARLLAYDLDTEAPLKNALYKAPDGAESRVVPAVGLLFMNGNQGYVVSNTPVETRTWVRMPGGELVSVPK